METSAPPPAVQKALTRLQASLAANQPYEGHELFKTQFHRSRARKQLEASYALAESGAVLQLQKGQVHCGVELGCMLLDAYDTDAAPATDEAVQRVTNIMEAFPRQPSGEEEDPPIEGCSKVASAAVKWLRKMNALQQAQKVSAALAGYIIGCLGWRGLGIALPHFARSRDFPSLVKILKEAVAAGAPGEEDLFLARAALQVAASGPLHAPRAGPALAQQLVALYRESGGLQEATPLVNFVDLFLEALIRRSSPLVEVLLQKYGASLDRDPTLRELVEKAREMHAPAPRLAAAGGGMFAEMFRGLLAPPMA